MQNKFRVIGLALMTFAVVGCATTTQSTRKGPAAADGAQQFVDDLKAKTRKAGRSAGSCRSGPTAASIRRPSATGDDL